MVFAITVFFTVAETIELLYSSQGASDPVQSSSSPVSPDWGSTIRHPLESIIHWQVPHSVQSTIGVPESLAACKATLLSPVAPSSSAPLFSPASSESASELSAARVPSARSVSSPSPSSATWAASAGSPESPASSACAFSAGISGQRDMARTAAKNDLNTFSVGLAEALIRSSPGAQFHLA